MREHKIAAIPGDGIGKEVIPAGLTVLRALQERCGDFRLVVEDFPWGSDYYSKTGLMMPDDGLDLLRKFDAIFFGAVGAPGFPITSRFGVCVFEFAKGSINTPMSGLLAFWPGSRVHCET